MKRVVAGMMVFACAGLLGGCDKTPEVPVASGDACESLEPLLAALPADKKYYRVPLTYRGCTLQSVTARAIYAAPGGFPSYEYTITVIDEGSKYLAAFATKDRPPETGQQVIDKVAILRQAWDERWNECKQDFTKPKDGTRPMLFNVNGMSVCIYGVEEEGSRRGLRTFGSHDGLAYQLTIRDEGATNAKDIVQALREVTPAFEKFKPEVLK
jgi:hypothetical protein